IMVERYEFLPDSGGPGKYRGALGIVRQYRFLAPDVLVQVRSDRFKSQPWGLHGGKPGANARAWLNPETPRQEALASKFIRTLQTGDVFRAEMAGSGGYGDPFEREENLVLQDLQQGKISPEHARDAYGVVVDSNLRLDAAATRQLR